VNDATSANVWQYGNVSDIENDRPAPAADGEPAGPAAREVSDVETLKALADPTRLAILNELLARGQVPLPVMSVKELAAALGEPQTKLYRHVKQLEAAGLIRVAASRLVSGILEQRYQASQSELRFGPGLLGTMPTGDTETLIAGVMDRYRSQFVAAQRAGLLTPAEDPAEAAWRQHLFGLTELRVSARRAAAVRAKLREALDELSAPGAEDPDGVPVNVLVGYFSAGPGPDGP
jgi:DNA-binding transcriptional ArsR family regulator